MLPKEDDHYVWMEWRFNSERMWVWWLNLAVYIGIVIAYFLIDGNEMIYCMYLPLDLLLNASKALYYFYHWREEDLKVKREEKRRGIFLEKKIQNALKSGVMQSMNMKSQDTNNQEDQELEKTLYGDELKVQKKKYELL